MGWNGIDSCSLPTQDLHKPSAVACANSIIGEIEDFYGLAPMASTLPRKLNEAITRMAFAISDPKFAREMVQR